MQLEGQGNFRARLRFLLLAALFFQIIAQAYDGLKHSTSVNSILFMNIGLSDGAANFLEQVLLFILIASFPAYIIGKKKIFLWYMSLWSLALPVSTFFLHSNFGYQFALFSQFARVALPLSLLLLDNLKGRDDWALILRIGIAATFFGHGLEALSLHPKFLDFLMDFSEVYLGFELLQNHAYTILYVIGVIDLAVALLALVTRFNMIFLYMALWGLITAICRITYFEGSGIMPFMVRSAHWVIPLVLFLYFRNKLIDGTQVGPSLKENYYDQKKCLN